jgi:predicted ATPase
MSELPTGTVTFLFTDVEGSTRLVQELGDDYAEVLAEHRRALREAFLRHGGVEVDTQGDAFFIAFARASEALAAAAEARGALKGGRVRVRMGLHTGEPLITDEGYVGVDVHRAARIAAAGHGGQILVSQSTRELVGANGLRDLGEHRLRDLNAPERIYQLGEGDFPPLKSLNQTNLPVQPTPLIGRRQELADALELFRSTRLLTFTGPGGSGKTRLALQAAAELLDDYPDGVWFVSLAALTDPELILPTIASTIGSKDDLIGFLDSKRALLVLDNLEQLLPDASLWVADLSAASGVHVLATSRERLAVSGEQEYPVPPLPTDDAVALFTMRARQLDPSFEPDDHVTAIVRRLDGLPLALELAAARVKVLMPSQILDRLANSLDLLTSGARDLPARQRTLRATIEWSCELLRPDEARLFDGLAVFAGSFDLEAAEVVARADLDALQSLVDKSLLRRTEEGRFFMPETIREFAVERLSESGDAETSYARHAEFFVNRATRLETERLGPRAGEVIAWFAAAERNIWSALEWLVAEGRGVMALQLATAAAPFWAIGAHRRKGLERLSRIIELAADSPDPALAGALFWAADLAERSGDLRRAKQWLEEARRLYSVSGDRSGESRCLADLGWIAIDERRHDSAIALARQAREIAIEIGDAGLVARAGRTLGYALIEKGDHPAAIAPLEEAVEARRQLGDPANLAATLSTLGEAYAAADDPARGEVLVEEALAIAREVGHLEYEAGALSGLSDIALTRDDLDAASARLAEALELATEISQELLVVWCVERAAVLAARQEDSRAAIRMLAAAEGPRRNLAVGVSVEDGLLLAEALRSCEEVLTADEVERESRVGRVMTLDDAVAEAQRVLNRAQPLEAP